MKDFSHKVVVLVARLEPLEVVDVSFVQAESKPVIEEGVTGAVITVDAALVNMRVNVTVQDGDSHRIVDVAGVAVHDVVRYPGGMIFL